MDVIHTRNLFGGGDVGLPRGPQHSLASGGHERPGFFRSERNYHKHCKFLSLRYNGETKRLPT